MMALQILNAKYPLGWFSPFHDFFSLVFLYSDLKLLSISSINGVVTKYMQMFAEYLLFIPDW